MSINCENYKRHLFECIILLTSAFFLSLACTSCSTNTSMIAYESDDLTLIKLSENVYQHITYLETREFGNVPCNGLVYAIEGESVIFDTPSTNEVSEELIRWVEESLKSEIVAIVPTHFHVDCLGGLDAFHEHSIPSFSLMKTRELSEIRNFSVPQNGFEQSITIEVGRNEVIIEHLGEGHTRDNVVGYIPSERVLFGGCLIKRVGAGKGNLEDANTRDWSKTASKVKSHFPNAKIVVPGHGKSGGQELIDYTILLFKIP